MLNAYGWLWLAKFGSRLCRQNVGSQLWMLLFIVLGFTTAILAENISLNYYWLQVYAFSMMIPCSIAAARGAMIDFDNSYPETH